jgi:hypothetical protein
MMAHPKAEDFSSIPVAPENRTSNDPEAEGERVGVQKLRGAHGQIANCLVVELQPHPSYARHNLSVDASKLAALANLGDLAFDYPLIITRDRFIIDGYGRWELAKRNGLHILSCVEYDLTEHEALQWFIQTHHPSHGFNDFIRIELALDLEKHFQQKAQLNQQAGGRDKVLSKLTTAERVNSRREIAQVAHVSVGNVHKVKYILAHACSSLREATRAGEISINLADKRSHEPEAEQQEHLRLLRIERGIRKKARQLVASHLVKPSTFKANERVLQMSDLIRMANQLAATAPEESSELGSIEINVLNCPGRAIFVTEELFQALRSPQEVVIGQ